MTIPIAALAPLCAANISSVYSPDMSRLATPLCNSRVFSVERDPYAGQLIPYPTGALRAALRLPILLYRLGMGWLLAPIPLMILTTRGRRSGAARHTPIEFRGHGSKFYIVSLWGSRPHWFQNLLAEPKVTIQQGSRQFAARAQVVDSHGEALRVLHLFRRRVPAIYDAVMARMSGESTISVQKLPELSRAFTIVRLDRLPNEPLPLPPVAPDLAWIAPMGILAGAVTLALLVFSRSRRS